MENKLEKVLQFEGQDIKVITDKGIEMFNLANSAMVLGITKKANSGKLIVNWKSGSNSILNKLNTIYSDDDMDKIGKDEIKHTLICIENIEKRKNIFISLELLLNLCLECNNKKAKEFYSYLLNNYKNIEFNPNCPKRKELTFLDKLEQALKPFNIIGERQYLIKNKKNNNYRIDYYISQLNIAIEYDENGHANYTYEQQKGRQKEIENKLGCKFIRVTDKNSDEYNIGLIIKELFDYNYKFIINLNNTIENEYKLTGRNKNSYIHEVKIS